MNPKNLVIFLLCSFMLFAFSSKAQYPFEKYKPIKYKRVKFKIKFSKDSAIVYYNANLPGIHKDKSKYTISISCNRSMYEGHAVISIKKDGKTFQKISEKGISVNGLSYLYIADINGDNLPDIKISCPNIGACGLAAIIRTRVYLFQKPNGKFNKISYSDMDCNDIFDEADTLNYWPERDFDNSGKYKIITCTMQGYKAHNYWTYDVYEYNNGNLECVDDKYNYPIMIQYLYRKNYEVTKKISPEKMKTFKSLKPEGYQNH